MSLDTSEGSPESSFIPSYDNTVSSKPDFDAIRAARVAAAMAELDPTYSPEILALAKARNISPALMSIIKNGGI